MKNKLKRILSYSIQYGKLLISWIIVHTVCCSLLKEDIWLIREKRDEARDNGYHFYKYLKETCPEINAYYVIKPGSSDQNKVEQYGNTIKSDSWKHCIYFLAAKYSISSQAYGAYPFSFSARMLNHVQKLCNKKQKVVFLQHGIIQNRLPSDSFLYHMCNIDYFVTSTKREYDFIRETYKYPKHAIGCVGLARFDYLHTPHSVEKEVLVMPTWRCWLNQMNFGGSTYFSAYAALLSNEKLIQGLRARGYKLIFYMHYKLQPFVESFKKFENDVVVIADKTKYDVQKLLMSSQLMITDYSSVHFDFAYMDKPLAYYQFDKQQFRQSHYEEGYFSYEEDGFGPCFEDFAPLQQYIFEMIENQCQQLEKYSFRAKEFFDLRDNHNCERIFNAIKAL